jgi:hypothetical protein
VPTTRGQRRGAALSAKPSCAKRSAPSVRRMRSTQRPAGWCTSEQKMSAPLATIFAEADVESLALLVVVVALVSSALVKLLRGRTVAGGTRVTRPRTATPTPFSYWYAQVPFEHDDGAKERPVLVLRVEGRQRQGAEGHEQAQVRSDQLAQGRYVWVGSAWATRGKLAADRQGHDRPAEGFPTLLGSRAQRLLQTGTRPSPSDRVRSATRQHLRRTAALRMQRGSTRRRASRPASQP